MLVSIIAMPRPKSGERSGALRKRYVSSGVEYEPYVYQLFTRMPRGLAGRPQNGAQDSAEQIAAARNEATHTELVRSGVAIRNKGTAMKKIAGIAAILMLLSTNLVFAQANPNQGATSSSQSNEQQRERSVPGNPNNPGPR